MLPLEVVHQLILPCEPVQTLAGAVTVGTVEVFGTGFMALHVTCKVVLVLEALSAAGVGAGETTVGDESGDRSRGVEGGAARNDNGPSVVVLEGGCGHRPCVDVLGSSRSRSKTKRVIIEVTVEPCEA